MNRSWTRAGSLSVALGLFLYGAVACSDDDSATPAPSVDGGGGGGTDSGPSGKTDADVKEDAATADAGSVSVSLKFKAKVGDKDFKCGTTYTNQGTKNDTIEPRDLRFFVQDVKLVDGAGNEVPVTLDARSPWQTPDVALLDFEDATGKCTNGNAELNDTVTGTVPAGTYTGIVFTNGVPASLNHLDPAGEKAPLSAGGMTWGWLLGHLFIKAEVASTTSDGGIGLLHLGSVGCANDAGAAGDDFNKAPTAPCSQPNRNLVKLTGFDASKNVIVLDVKTMFASTDLSAPSMCHSMGDSCPPLFSSVGLKYEDGARLATAPAFRVE